MIFLQENKISAKQKTNITKDIKRGERNEESDACEIFKTLLHCNSRLSFCSKFCFVFTTNECNSLQLKKLKFFYL